MGPGRGVTVQPRLAAQSEIRACRACRARPPNTTIAMTVTAVSAIPSRTVVLISGPLLTWILRTHRDVIASTNL
jgi:hypothetical protein